MQLTLLSVPASQLWLQHPQAPHVIIREEGNYENLEAEIRSAAFNEMKVKERAQ